MNACVTEENVVFTLHDRWAYKSIVKESLIMNSSASFIFLSFFEFFISLSNSLVLKGEGTVDENSSDSHAKMAMSDSQR